jgi:hypothetical protein
MFIRKKLWLAIWPHSGIFQKKLAFLKQFFNTNVRLNQGCG